MDVTRDNFRQTLPLVKQAIKEASFIAIDGEFTGLSNGSFNTTAYDSPPQRYLKLHSNTHNFLLIQFGMCAFRWSDESQKYKAEAFNFYIFPLKSTVSGVPDRIFSCQSSSLDFLTKQGFDFNKAFKNGIPYLRPNEEATVRATLEEKQTFRENAFRSPVKRKNNSNNSSPVSTDSPTSAADQKAKEFVETAKQKVQKFLEDANQEEELILESCNSYFRKLLFESLPLAFPDQVLVESRTNEHTKLRHIVVVKGASSNIKKARQELTKAREEAELEDAIGFSKVISCLSESGKLVVGHNMFLDVIYTIQQFVHPLPNDLEEFKSLVSCVFPKVLDTKLMGSMLPFKDQLQSTALGDMHNRLKLPPFNPVGIETPGKYNIGTNDEHNHLHEAAYDAFITGSSFLSMVNFLSSFQSTSNPIISFSSLCNLVSPYVNKIFLMRSHDIPYLNISGTDLTPSRDHVFHVQFPASWRSNDIRQLFAPVGQINISWIDETHCLVGLYNKVQAKNVKNLVKSGTVEPGLYCIQSYDDYQAEPQLWLPTSQRNMVWRSNSTSNSVVNTPTRAKPALSFTSGLGQTSITPPTADVSTPLYRKRQGSFANRETTNGSLKDCDENDVEPLLKRQKSQENCTEDLPETHVKQDEAEVGEVSNVAASSGLFVVPDQWE
uniref:Poly(A)-specific ribonuclease PARN n=1 Tax=Phallusia mammillata TaxID=59560 RepID=A0A6F9DPQ5_9ASCI|nr:poly(A)-specific ribonuclease PARN [Phallusia mammillata]